MVRFVIIGVVIAVALTLYALVDAAMTDGSRARGVNKPVWIVIIAVLPVIGALLWFFIGKGSAAVQTARRIAPDDDPRFSGTRLSSSDLDAHMRDLEDRLRELDDETFPGEERAGRRDSAAPAGADADADAGSVLDESSSESSASGLDAGAVSAGPEDTLSTGGEGASRSPRGDGADGATDAPAAASDTGARGGGAPTGDIGADGDARESTADAGADAADADARQRERRQPRGAAEGPGTRSDGDPKP